MIFNSLLEYTLLLSTTIPFSLNGNDAYIFYIFLAVHSQDNQ